MKKLIIAISGAMLLATSAFSMDFRPSVGISGSMAVYAATGTEKNFNEAGTAVDTTTDEHGAFVAEYGSIFLEAALNDAISIGIDYVPMSMETETTENIQNIGNLPADPGSGEKRNTVKVSFEDLTTIYALANLNDNVYAKVGYVEVDVITDENLATGGAYGNTSFDGFTIALGYSLDMADGTFARFEASYMDLDGATVTNDNDSTKSVTVDGINGYGAGISIGRSF